MEDLCLQILIVSMSFIKLWWRMHFIAMSSMQESDICHVDEDAWDLRLDTFIFLPTLFCASYSLLS